MRTIWMLLVCLALLACSCSRKLTEPTAPPLGEEIDACKVDADCAFNENGCCGGRAVNRAHAKRWGGSFCEQVWHLGSGM